MANEKYKLPEPVMVHLQLGGKAYRERWEDGARLKIKNGALIFDNTNCERKEYRTTGEVMYMIAHDDHVAEDWTLV